MNVVDKGFELRREVRLTQGFDTYVLSNDRLEIAIVPELGARILSLVDKRTSRDWMWFPQETLQLFRNIPGEDFGLSPLAGADECLPTIAPCHWQGRLLPDHGEVWAHPWALDPAHWEEGLLTTSIKLSTSPLRFERTIELRGSEARLRYKLTNCHSAEELYIWALHPLLRLCDGDRLVLTPETRSLLGEISWVDAIDHAVPEGGCSKLFAGPLTRGAAAIHNQVTGERLEFEWDTSVNPNLGIWLTRGGWNGHDHFALEPTNCCDDALNVSADRGCCGRVPGSGAVAWSIKIRLGP